MKAVRTILFGFFLFSISQLFGQNDQLPKPTVVKVAGFYQKRETIYGVKNKPEEIYTFFSLYDYPPFKRVPRYQCWMKYEGGDFAGKEFYEIISYETFEFGTVYICQDMNTKEKVELTFIQHPEKGNLMSVKKGNVDTDYFDPQPDRN